MEERLVILEQRLALLEKELARNAETHRNFFTRFEKMKEAQVRTDVQYANILTSLAKVEQGIEEVKGRPARRWETVISAALQWIVVAVLAAIIVLK